MHLLEAKLSLESALAGSLHTRLWREAGVRVWRTLSWDGREGRGSLHLLTPDGEVLAHFRLRGGRLLEAVYQVRSRWGETPQGVVGVLGHAPTALGSLQALVEDPGLLPPPFALRRGLSFSWPGRWGLPRSLDGLLEAALEDPEAAPVFLGRLGAWLSQAPHTRREAAWEGVYEARLEGSGGPCGGGWRRGGTGRWRWRGGFTWSSPRADPWR